MFESVKWPRWASRKDGKGQETPVVCYQSRNAVSSFKSDEEGSVAVMFALMTVVVMSLVGGAIDYGRATTARDQMQNAVDASVLAAARVWQTENSMALAELKGLQYYDQNKPDFVQSTVTGFTPDLARNAIVMEATAEVSTPFLSLIRGQGFPIYARSEAQLAVGGNAEINLEISLMLDVTGSMGGQKLRDMKDAAKDLIDIVVWDDQSEYTSKVALAPFADRINVGQYASVMTGLPPTRTVTTTTKSKKKKKKTVTTTEYLIECVTDRWGVAQHSDDAPDVGNNRELGPYDGDANADIDDQYQENNGNCNRPTAEIMPLTSNKTDLKARIDSFVASGGTAGALGTEMAWYLISPKWAHIWPAGSTPVAYNTPKYQKIAVLMTDGEYNVYRGGSWSSSSVSAFAKNTCREMKTAGVIVYTVGFQLASSGNSRSVMQDCASDPSKFYEASDGDALRQAFRDIALQLAKLRLSQ